MDFQGVTYYIPVVIWLMESYPRHPPFVYVNPTRHMLIKRPHSHVNPSGMVSVPYLHNWLYPSSNLLHLAQQLSAIFSQDPPLYSHRPLNPNPSPDLGSRPAIPPRTYPPSPYGGGSVGEDPNPAEVFKRNAVNKLVETVHGDMAGMRRTRESEMEGLFSARAVLRQREHQLNRGLREMQDEKEGLEQQLQMVLMNMDVMEAWLRDNEGKIGKSGDLNVDDAFDCVDTLSKQMLESTASDLAIEDTIYALDKAAQEGDKPFDQYLRNVRLLSREQFLHRATASKIQAVQMQVQVAGMAARALHYG